MTAYIYGELVDYLDDIKESNIEEDKNRLLDQAAVILRGNFKQHNKAERELRDELRVCDIAIETSEYQRGYLNICQVAETIIEMLA